jgi:drug/metabolite transporter (DMT)-like permease
LAYVWFVFICVTWGSSMILMKKAALAMSPLEIATWRLIGGAVTLGLLCWWNRSTLGFRRQDWRWLLVIVVLGYAWPYSWQPWLVARHGSAFIGMTVSFVPLLTILVSVPILGVFPTARQVAGVLGALVCLGMLVIDGIQRAIPLRDLVLAGTVPLGYAICNVCIRRWLSHVAPLPLSFQSMAVSGLLLLPISLNFRGPVSASSDDWMVAIGSVAVLGIFSTGLAIWLFNKLIHEQGPLFAGMATNLVPVGAVLWGWLDQETVSPLQVVALLGIVLMVSVVQFGAASRSTVVREVD